MKRLSPQEMDELEKFIKTPMAESANREECEKFFKITGTVKNCVAPLLVEHLREAYQEIDSLNDILSCKWV